MHQHIVPIVPRTFAEVGIEVWGGILVGLFPDGGGGRSVDVVGDCMLFFCVWTDTLVFRCVK